MFEFVLLSFIGIIIIVGMFTLYKMGIKPIYEKNFYEQMSILKDKIYLGDKLYSRYHPKNIALIFIIPKKINNKEYMLTKSINNHLVVKSGNELHFIDLSDVTSKDVIINSTIPSSTEQIKATYHPNEILLQQIR